MGCRVAQPPPSVFSLSTHTSLNARGERSAPPMNRHMSPTTLAAHPPRPAGNAPCTDGLTQTIVTRRGGDADPGSPTRRSEDSASLAGGATMRRTSLASSQGHHSRSRKSTQHRASRDSREACHSPPFSPGDAERWPQRRPTRNLTLRAHVQGKGCECEWRLPKFRRRGRSRGQFRVKMRPSKIMVIGFRGAAVAVFGWLKKRKATIL